MSAKFTLTEMITALIEESEYIDQCEQAAIMTGFRAEPLPERARKAELFRATARFLDRVMGSYEAVVKVLKGKET